MSDDKMKRLGQRQELVGSFKKGGLKVELEVPVTLEHVLLRATEDHAFRGEFLEDPIAAVEAAGMRLTDSETALLHAASRESLEAMVSRFAPTKQRNRRFVRAVAAAAMVGGMLVTTCTADDTDLKTGGDSGDSDTDLDSDGDSDDDADTDTDTETDTETVTDTDTGTDTSTGE